MKTNIENNQETLYNNNESESGINVRNKQYENEQRTDSWLFAQYEEGKGIGAEHQEYNEQQRELYKQEENNITNEQKQLRNNIKRQYNKNIVFFDGNNSQYNGGALLTNSDNIYILI